MCNYKFNSIFKKFHNIDKNLILNFYQANKSNRIHPTKSLEQINDWLLRFDININSLDLNHLLEYHEKRCLRLSQGNLKHPSVIDISLFEIYAPSKEIALEEYEKYKQNKSKNMIETLNENPELRKGLSLEFQKQKHGNEIGEIRYAEIIKKQKNSSKRCKEYWMLQGYSEEEATEKVSEAQATFSLEKCIGKYGEEEGYRIWKERQDKWQNTLKSKPYEELDRINKKKNIFSIESYILRGFSEHEAKELLEEKIKMRSTRYSKECVEFIQKNFSNLEGCLYGENEWGYYNTKLDKISFFDFTNLNKKIIFEYHGECFHPNIRILSENELKNWTHLYTKANYKEILNHDLYKKQLAKSLGFKYFSLYSNDTQEIKYNIIYKINKILNT